MKNNKGFTTVLMMSLLPALLAAGTLVFLFYSFLRSDLATLNACRTQQLKLQAEAGQHLKLLLELNPQAAALRDEEQTAEEALAEAEASMDPPAVMTAQAELIRVQSERRALGQKQKALIDGANSSLKNGGEHLQQHLTQVWNHEQGPLRSWWQADLRLRSARVPRLSVKPDAPDTAPVYEPVPQFEDAQTWAQNWQLALQTKGWTQNFLPLKLNFERSCASSLYEKENSWVARLKKDKF